MAGKQGYGLFAKEDIEMDDFSNTKKEKNFCFMRLTNMFTIEVYRK